MLFVGLFLVGLTQQSVPFSQARGPEDVRRAIEASDYAEAERLGREWCAAVEATSGPESADMARALDDLVYALVENGKSGDAATLALAERAVRLKERLLGQNDIGLSISLHNLGTVHTERGEYREAVLSHTRGLSIRTRLLPPFDTQIADSLDLLAVPLILQEQFRDARDKLTQAIRIRRNTTTPLPVGLARTLQTVALLNRWDGHYADAVETIDQALAIRRVSSDSIEELFTLRLRGDLLFLGGDIGAARAIWSEALVLAEQRLRSDHPAVVPLLRDLAVAERAFGDLASARQLLQRALTVTHRSLAPCHQEIPSVLDDFAGIAEYDGDYARARTLYAQALSARQHCLGPNHSLTATVVHNQANLAAEMGDLAEAQRLHERAIRLWSIGLGPNHPYVARGLDALAQVVASRGDLAMARSLYSRALSIRRKTLGENHPDVAWTLSNLAEVTAAAGQIRLAKQRADEAIGIYNRAGVSDEPDHFARVLALRGALLAKQADFAGARASFAEALGERERVFGTTHPLTAAARADLASADFALGSNGVALKAALEAEQIARDHLRFTIRYLPERQAMAYAAARPRGLDLALSINTADRASSPALVLDAVVRSRGVILDELAARAQVAAANPQRASTNIAFVAAQQRFANLMLRSLQGEESVPAQMLEAARQQKEDAERAMAEQSATARSELARGRVGLDDVRRALPAGSALVSFVRYDRTSIVTPQSSRLAGKTPAYIAYVSHSDTLDVQAVPLGAASSIERLADTWHAEAGGRSITTAPSAREAERAYRTAATALRLRIWDPLAEAIRGASRVFIVPDGALNLVSFAALPSGSRYLLENGPTIHYLSTERDLISGDTPAGHGLLAVGGPAFDLRVTATATNTRRSGCGAVGSLHFEDLPGSRAEVQDIARIWGNPTDVLLLTGRAATKSAITRALVGRKVVHLATHGFFLGSECESASGLTRGIGSVVGAAASERTDNPLLLAGLALAGVNQLSRANQANGILNAEEIAGLNLQGTEWVVLSACDTGLGQITAGEGVFGLRRALQIAGVHTIIMSLWSVEDQHTRDWMKALYAARLEKGLDTPAAVHDAGVRIIEERRKRGQSTHPFYWGAFVAAGDWR